jgi:hypothetical protein
LLILCATHSKEATNEDIYTRDTGRLKQALVRARESFVY